MPYADKKLKAEYQKRTATPYMKKWREQNREKHREYMRQHSAKRRADAKKKARDKAAAIKSGVYEKWQQYTKQRQRIWVDNLSDIYIVGLLARKGSLTRELAMDNYEIIDLHRTLLITKRKLAQQ